MDARDAPAAISFSWAAAAAAALGRNGVITMTSAPASWHSGEMSPRLPAASSTTRPPKRVPAWSARPASTLAASSHSAPSLPWPEPWPEPEPEAEPARASCPRTQRSVAAAVRDATSRCPAAYRPSQRVWALWYTASW